MSMMATSPTCMGAWAHACMTSCMSSYARAVMRWHRACAAALGLMGCGMLPVRQRCTGRRPAPAPNPGLGWRRSWGRPAKAQAERGEKLGQPQHRRSIGTAVAQHWRNIGTAQHSAAQRASRRRRRRQSRTCSPRPATTRSCAPPLRRPSSLASTAAASEASSPADSTSTWGRAGARGCKGVLLKFPLFTP